MGRRKTRGNTSCRKFAFVMGVCNPLMAGRCARVIVYVSLINCTLATMEATLTRKMLKKYSLAPPREFIVLRVLLFLFESSLSSFSPLSEFRTVAIFHCQVYLSSPVVTKVMTMAAILFLFSVFSLIISRCCSGIRNALFNS